MNKKIVIFFIIIIPGKQEDQKLVLSCPIQPLLGRVLKSGAAAGQLSVRKIGQIFDPRSILSETGFGTCFSRK